MERIAELIIKYLKSEISPAEEIELQEWVNEKPENQELFNTFNDPDQLRDLLNWTTESKSRILEDLRVELYPRQEAIAMKRWNFRRFTYVAAAVIFLVMAGGLYYFLRDKGEEKLIGKTQELPIKNDIKAPEKNLAVITLDNGKKVYLDGVENGVLLNEESVKIEKLADGKISYNNLDSKDGQQLKYNTITNPRGSKVIDITLEDGSRVWLNNESSIRFPVAFDNDERRVEITGEAYFEVSKDPKKKFIVKANGTATEVLGTKFNINAYSEELSVNTTLIEGKVRVNSGNRSVLIKPGEQTQANGESINVVEKVDLESVIAWKNGMTVLNRADLKSLLNTISRWYDVDVEMKSDLDSNVFLGSIPRNLRLQDVSKALENITNLKFTIEGRKLIVSK
jgi:ferric-dicitrate binding protein FerR (iron transport regulator)